MCIAKALQILKANSSRFIEEHGINFDWQVGYGAFSVCKSQIERVKQYIANQKELHRKQNFEEEFIALLKAHGVDLRPKVCFWLTRIRCRASGARNSRDDYPAFHAGLSLSRPYGPAVNDQTPARFTPQSGPRSSVSARDA